MMNRARISDHPYIWGVTEREFYGEKDRSVPDACWDLVFIKYQGKTEVLLTGTLTRPIELAFPAGTEQLCITFKPGVYLPGLPSPQRVNQGINLPNVSPQKMWFGSDVLEIPGFDNVEVFVDKLFRLGLVARDELVASFIDGQPMAASERSVQRHFYQTTGMTMNFVRQIQRAQLAAELLKSGEKIVDVAHKLGFTDQAHMTRSLKGILGLTPAAIAQANSNIGGFLQNNPQTSQV